MAADSKPKITWWQGIFGELAHKAGLGIVVCYLFSLGLSRYDANAFKPMEATWLLIGMIMALIGYISSTTLPRLNQRIEELEKRLASLGGQPISGGSGQDPSGPTNAEPETRTGGQLSFSIPWWVAWFTTEETTPKSLRQDGWFSLFAGAAVLIGCGVAAFFEWQSVAYAGLLPAAAFAINGIWTLAALSWLNRNHGWDRLSNLPKANPQGSGLIVLVVGLAFLTVAGWRYWVYFQGPDNELLFYSRPFSEESRQLQQEYMDRIKNMKARNAMKGEYLAEMARNEAATKKLQLRQEAEIRASVPMWRWFELGMACLVLIFGLGFCASGYLQLRGKISDGGQTQKIGPETAPGNT